MNIEKFYPNILSDGSADIIRIMWEESDLPLKIDGEFLSRYLGKHLSKEEIKEEGFEDLVFKKKDKEKKKKKVIPKKISKRHLKKKTTKGKAQKEAKKISQVKESMDTSSNKGDDTLTRNAEEEQTENEIVDINISKPY